MNKYSKETGARGRDPLGHEDLKRTKKSKFQSPLALAHYDAVVKSMGNKKAKDIISEDKKIDEVSKEYDEYKSKNSVD